MRFLLFIIFIIIFAGCDSNSSKNDNDLSDVDTTDDSIMDEDSAVDDDAVNNSDEDEADDEITDEINDDSFVVIEGDLECTENDKYWIYDLSSMPPKNIQICAHVRSESAHVRVLVEDDAWGTKVDADEVIKLLTAWEIQTPSDKNNGIYQIVTKLFGEVPDVFDEYPGIYLFLYQIADYNGNSFDGYFRVDDQNSGSYSNKREMIHLNVAKKSPADNYMLSVQAHEFQHLIHWGADKDEDPWLNESMSELAMVITGFGSDDAWVNSWLSAPTAPLMSNGPSYDYGVLLLFGAYLYDRFGEEFISELVFDGANGMDSIDATLGHIDQPTYFHEAAADFSMAVLAQDSEYQKGQFGFTSITPSKKAASKTVTASSDSTAAADGGMAFFKIEEYVSGNTVTVSSTGTDAVYGRAALVSNEGSIITVSNFTLDGGSPETEVTFEETGTVLISAFNPAATAAKITVTLP